MEFPPSYPSLEQTAAAQPSPGPSSSSSGLTSGHVIAIDFGTTYTGVAHIEVRKTISLKPDDIADLLPTRVVRRWRRGTSNRFDDQVPTVLSYDANRVPQHWGYSVTADDALQARYFKLGLQPGAYEDEQTDIAQLTESGWCKSPKELATEYLTHVLAHLHKAYLPSIYPAAFLSAQTFHYVVTVPAIWNDKAKNDTREIAVSAGIPDSNLVLITEPEAAALYCATAYRGLALAVGDQFMVCDVGGGTVVTFLLTLH
jgi:molecular chaperone DnaK (HSP70)